MPNNRDNSSLLDIVGAARKVLQYKLDMDKALFMSDDKTQSAIVFQLLIIGEAVKRLSVELRDKHPEIPWSLIARMRDNLIHRYDNIDADEVWKTSDQDIPALLVNLEPLLPKKY